MKRTLGVAVPVSLIAILAFTLGGPARVGGWLGLGSSGGAESDPVTFVWSVFSSHQDNGSRLFIQSRSPVAAAEVRLLAPDGTVVASAPAASAGVTGESVGCMPVQNGSARAAVPLSRGDLELFWRSWPSGYRVEAQVGRTWRPVQLAYAGCWSIE